MASAQGIPAKAEEPLVITNAGQFWELSAAEKQRAHPVSMEVLVYYYDASWKLLWGENSGGGVFLPVRGPRMRVAPGERVKLEGTVVPAAGLDADHVRISVLAEHAMPSPLSTRGRIGDFRRFDAQWVSIRGFVCGQSEIDPSHLELKVLSEGRLIEARLLLGDSDPIPQLVGAHVDLHCVYVAARDSAGELRQINAWVPSRTAISLLGWLDGDPRFNLPRASIDEISSMSPDEWMHVAGRIVASDPGHSVTIRDNSGQVKVWTEQPQIFRIGDTLEFFGHPKGRYLDTTLTDAVFRVVSAGARAGSAERAGRSEPMLKLRLADQVMELPPEEAAQGYPVYLRGIVTWSNPRARFFFLQDTSSGIRVRIGEISAAPPQPGTMVALLGVSRRGEFAPEVEMKEMTIIEPAAFPRANPITLEQALAGANEDQRVELRGYLRKVEHVGPVLALELTTATGEFTAVAPPDPRIEASTGAVVRVTGVCTAEANPQHQLTGVRLWIAEPQAVEIVEPAPANPFDAPSRSIGSLRQFLAYHALERRVRVDGTVLYNKPGRYLYLQQDDAALLVLHRDTRPLAPGEAIEAVGLPGRDGSRLVLRETIWRRIERSKAAAPLRLLRPQVLTVNADGRLVKLEGRVQDIISDGRERRLLVRDSGTLFEAVLDDAPYSALPRTGSLIEATGVYVLSYDEYRQPRLFSLRLRTPHDIRVIAAAPWWTARRALGIAGAFAFCAVLGIAGVIVLRRRVKRQTEQIRVQLEKEARLNTELERATRLESLGVLAGGIAHDFNNLLTVIMANLGLAAMDDRVQAAAGDVIADAERGARRAAELTQQLLTFAKGGDPVRRAVELPDVVREAAEFARHASRVRCDLEIEQNLPPADVDRGQISRVVHNLVLNATQAMPEGGVIRVNLAAATVGRDDEPGLAAGRYLKLSVADSGSGIAPENLQRIFEPYFSTKPKNSGLGLATVHSIVKKHQGHIRVQSEPGRGTTFHVWLPVAKEAPQELEAAAGAPRTAMPVRVLFMDDEEVIRRAAGGVLRQLGHDTRIVADGADAVREYEAALRSGRPFDVVVLDLTVPGGMGGLAAIEEMRRVDPRVRAIVSSGYSNDPVLAKYREYGFCAVVPKPYEIADLARAIQEVVSERSDPNAVHTAA